MSELHDDLLSTSEDISADAARLQKVESKKRELPPGHPALVTLSKQAEDLGEQIAKMTSIEVGLAKDAAR